jgi:hypothetical protein
MDHATFYARTGQATGRYVFCFFTTLKQPLIRQDNDGNSLTHVAARFLAACSFTKPWMLVCVTGTDIQSDVPISCEYDRVCGSLNNRFELKD